MLTWKKSDTVVGVYESNEGGFRIVRRPDRYFNVYQADATTPLNEKRQKLDDAKATAADFWAAQQVGEIPAPEGWDGIPADMMPLDGPPDPEQAKADLYQAEQEQLDADIARHNQEDNEPDPLPAPTADNPKPTPITPCAKNAPAITSRTEAGYVIGENGRAVCPGVVCRCDDEGAKTCPMHGAVVPPPRPAPIDTNQLGYFGSEHRPVAAPSVEQRTTQTTGGFPNKDFARLDKTFNDACALAGVKPTRRQASKWRNGRGQAYEAHQRKQQERNGQ